MLATGTGFAFNTQRLHGIDRQPGPACARGRPPRLIAPPRSQPEYDREVVGGHLYDLLEPEPMGASDLGDAVEVPHSPLRVPGSQLRVEGRVACGRMSPLTAIRAVEDHHAFRAKDAACACDQSHRRFPGR